MEEQQQQQISVKRARKLWVWLTTMKMCATTEKIVTAAAAACRVLYLPIVFAFLHCSKYAPVIFNCSGTCQATTLRYKLCSSHLSVAQVFVPCMKLKQIIEKIFWIIFMRDELSRTSKISHSLTMLCDNVIMFLYEEVANLSG